MVVSESFEIECAYNPAEWSARVWSSRCGEERRATWPSRSRNPEREGADDDAWRVIHHGLVDTAKRQAELDAEQCELLREAEQLRIWIPLGLVSMLDYMERVLGQNPETARKRLRVARALGQLPKLTEALRQGELAFSAVKELSRVVTPSTEQGWIDAAKGASLRQVEDLVSGHARGDLPGDPPDPELRTRKLTYEVSAATYALVRQTQVALAEAHGRRLDEDELVATLCRATLEQLGRGISPGEDTHEVAGAEGDRAPASPREHSGRATFQIALVVCERCNQGWQDGGGARIPVDAAAVERATCDAQHIGSLDAGEPERASQSPPPSVVRFVRRRDGDRCQTPGCRSAFGLEIHHIVHREHGGTHDPSNLTVRCSACHAAHHDGRLTIRGTAPDRIVTEWREPLRPASSRHASQAPPNPTPEDEAAEARQALITLGFKPAVARAAVEKALGHVAHGAPLEQLLREALRRCPTGRTRPCR